MAAPLPQYFGLQTTIYGNKSFLSLPADEVLKVDGEAIMDPQSKFTIEKAQLDTGNTDQQLVHIRSCYNNKYWVLHEMDDGSLWIACSADAPDESNSKMACTLFEPVLENNSSTKYRFRHYRRQIFAMHDATQDAFRLSSSGTQGFVFKATDIEKLVILPPRLTFKLDSNYLCARMINEHRYLKFESGLDAADPSLVMEVIQDPVGTFYYIKHVQSGMLWVLKPETWDWVWAEGDSESEDSTSLLAIHVVNENVIALGSLVYGNFFGKLISKDGISDSLCNHYTTITGETKLVIEEPVLSREISNIMYHDSRVYNEEHIEQDSAYAVNDSDSDATITLTFIIKDTTTRFWHASVTLKLGVKATLTAALIPKIVEGKVEFYAEAKGNYEWGETTTVEITREVSYSVVVPPNSKRKVTLTAIRGLCDVPFSYTQTDVLFDGTTVVKDNVDGIFKGMNAYHFTCEAEVVN